MKIAIIGDYNEGFYPHTATSRALEHAAKYFDERFSYDWISTRSLKKELKQVVESYHGFWIAPGDTHQNVKATLDLLKHTRLNQLPTLGTCGGFHHMALEFTRNVLGMKDAEHAAYNTETSNLVIRPLSCNLKGAPMQVDITDEFSKTFSIYQSDEVIEMYYCDLGFNPEYQKSFQDNGFKIVATDMYNEPRILELSGHPFFIATLFLPQDSSSPENPHILISEFVRGAFEEYQQRKTVKLKAAS